MLWLCVQKICSRPPSKLKLFSFRSRPDVETDESSFVIRVKDIREKISPAMRSHICIVRSLAIICAYTNLDGLGLANIFLQRNVLNCILFNLVGIIIVERARKRCKYHYTFLIRKLKMLHRHHVLCLVKGRPTQCVHMLS